MPEISDMKLVDATTACDVPYCTSFSFDESYRTPMLSSQYTQYCLSYCQTSFHSLVVTDPRSKGNCVKTRPTRRDETHASKRGPGELRRRLFPPDRQVLFRFKIFARVARFDHNLNSTGHQARVSYCLRVPNAQRMAGDSR